MAYKKGYRRRYYKKKKSPDAAWASTGATVGRTAYKAYNLATKLARFVNTEFKYVELEGSDGPLTSGSIFKLVNPPLGTGDSNRTGDSIKLMRLTGRLWATGDGTINNTLLRVIIFRGKNENGVDLAVSDVLDTSGAYDYLAPKPHDDRFRTKILYDRYFNLTSSGGNGTYININQKLYGHCQFVNGSTTQYEDGGLYMVMITNRGTLPPTVNYRFKTTFVDN